jgi:hypothetical protein
MVELQSIDSKLMVKGQMYKIKYFIHTRIGTYMDRDNSSLYLMISDNVIKIPMSSVKSIVNYPYCEWESNSIIFKLMEVIADFHMHMIDSDNSFSILKDIIKDGSIFTNISRHGDVLYSPNPNSVIKYTKDFYSMTAHLANMSIRYVNFDWCFYRAMKKIEEDIIIQPVPFSVTSSLDLAVEWLEPKTIYKIIISGDTPFAILEPIYTPELKLTMTDDQLKLYEGEITLRPGMLTKESEELLYLQSGTATLITCTYNAFSEAEAISLLTTDLKKTQ